MPVTDEGEATRLILAHFKSAWDTAGAPATVVYENTSKDPPSDGSPYVKSFVRHAALPRATLAGVGQSRFKASGFALFEVYTRLGVGVTADANYAKIIREAFMGKATATGGIWFRNARSLEQGKRGGMYLTNVLVDFEYSIVG